MPNPKKLELTFPLPKNHISRVQTFVERFNAQMLPLFDRWKDNLMDDDDLLAAFRKFVDKSVMDGFTAEDTLFFAKSSLGLICINHLREYGRNDNN